MISLQWPIGLYVRSLRTDEPGSENSNIRGLGAFRTDLTTPTGMPDIPPEDASLHHIDPAISTPTQT